MKNILCFLLSFMLSINYCLCKEKQYNELKNIEITYDNFIYKYVFTKNNTINCIEVNEKNPIICTPEKIIVNIFNYNDYNGYAWCYNDTIYLITKVNEEIKQLIKKEKVPNLYQKNKEDFIIKSNKIESYITQQYKDVFNCFNGVGKGALNRIWGGGILLYADYIEHPIYFSLNMNKFHDIILQYTYKIRYIDSQNEDPSFGSYDEDKRHILPGKCIYIKLENNEIIKLYCKYRQHCYSDSGLDYPFWYTDYIVYSDFILNEEIINKLQNYKIIKIRLELQSKSFDINIDNECKAFIKSRFEESIIKLNNDYNLYLEEQAKIKTDSINQEKIKDNPLYNF